MFLFSTFGYICLLIIKKWTILWEIEVPASMAPSIIEQMIALLLKLGSTEGKVTHNSYLASMGLAMARRNATHSAEDICLSHPTYVGS
jgi:hypothetical protein